MATADVFVRAILQELVVQESEQQIEQAEAQDAIQAMNDWMTMQDALGVSIGYTLISGLGDEVTIPFGANTGLIKNVAAYMAPQFGATVTQATATMADTGLKAMRKLSPGQKQMHHPSTLPLGSGNEHPGFGGFSGRRFYPRPESELLTEQGGSILLESDTNDAS